MQQPKPTCLVMTTADVVSNRKSTPSASRHSALATSALRSFVSPRVLDLLNDRARNKSHLVTSETVLLFLDVDTLRSDFGD